LPFGDEPCGDLKGGRGEVIADFIVGTEQRFGFAAQLFVLAARPIEEGRPRFRLDL